MKKNNFQYFQKESPLGTILFIIQKIQKDIGQLLSIFALSFFQENFRNYLTYILFGYFIWILVRAYLNYKNFMFRIDYQKREFVLKRGVFRKQIIYIPLNKIQNVEMSQSFIQRVLQLTQLKIDSAGSENEEIIIPALQYSNSVKLANELNTSNEFRSNSLKGKNNTREVLEISANNLLWCSIFYNHFRTFWVVLCLIFAFYAKVRDYILEQQTEDEWYEKMIAYFSESHLNYWFITTFLLIGFVLILLTIIRNFSLFFPYKIELNPEIIVLKYGNIYKHISFINIHRIQIMRLRQNYFERKCNLFNLQFSQINENEENEKQIQF